VLPDLNPIPCRSGLHHPVMFGICNTGTLLCGSAKDKKNGRRLRLQHAPTPLNERLPGYKPRFSSKLCRSSKDFDSSKRSHQEGEFLTPKSTKSRLKAERCYESRTQLSAKGKGCRNVGIAI
jgi:hypothetical protein